MMGQVAAIHALLPPPDASIPVGKGEQIEVPDDTGLVRAAAWPQVLELDADCISSNGAVLAV